MENRFKKWELALMAGLLVGILSSPGSGAQLPLSRWQEQETHMRYQVSLFPFGFVEADGPSTVQPQEGPGYEIRSRILEWWEDVFR